MAYWTGFKHGRHGEAATYRFSHDPLVNEYYIDGHRLGCLFKPVKNVAKSDPSKLRRAR